MPSPKLHIRQYLILCLALFGLCFATIKLDDSEIDPGYPIRNYQEIHKPVLDMLNRALPLMKSEVEAALDPRSRNHATALTNLKTVFGENPNLLQIKNMVVAYMSEDLKIVGDNVPLPRGDTSYGKTYKRQILFTTRYHDRTLSVNQRLRVLAHEGSHAISAVQTYDWFGYDEKRPIHIYAISQEELQREDAVIAKQKAGRTLTMEDKSHLHPAKINGYWQQSYHTLKESVSDIMHLNADTWAVWAYRVLNGRLPPVGAVTCYDYSERERTSFAIGCGIRHIDTAQLYKNEMQTGEAIRESGVDREQIYVTSKYTDRHFYVPSEVSEQEGPTGCEPIPLEKVTQLIKDSIERLGFIPDLYLIHSPFVARPGELKALWKIFEDLKGSGTLKSIGVSNFRPQDLEEILEGATYKPVVNQIEYHPYTLTHLEPLLKLQAEHGILTESYGGLTPIIRHPSGGGPLVPILERIAARLTSALGKTVKTTTVLLLWLRAQGVIAVTASANQERIKELGEIANLPEGLLEEAEVEEITSVGKGVHFRHYREHMEKDFLLPNLPSS